MREKVVKIITWTICALLDCLTITFLILNCLKVISWPFGAILSPLIVKIIIQGVFLFVKNAQMSKVTRDGGDESSYNGNSKNNT